MQLIVHIGTGKTGSSSIQRTLVVAKAVLRQRGIAYLGLMGEELPQRYYSWQRGGWSELWSLGAAVAQQQLSDLLQKGIAALQAAGCDRVIWSNETIFGNHELVMPALQALRDQGVQVSIVVYLRRHDAWARSAYLQWGVKHKTYEGAIKPFAAWYRENQQHFFSGLEPWIAADWDDISVRNYDTCGDVAVDFVKYCGLNPADFQIEHENQTPNAVALALWALYNAQFDGTVLPVELHWMFQRSGVLTRTPVECNWDTLYPSKQELEAVATGTTEDRKLLDAVLAEHGQPSMATSPLPYKSMSVSQSQINAAFLLILKSQSDQIALLERELAQLKAA
jgi:hypothetical protein